MIQHNKVYEKIQRKKKTELRKEKVTSGPDKKNSIRITKKLKLYLKGPQ